MKTFYKKVKTVLNNLPLKKKFLFIICFVLLFTTLGSLFGIRLLYLSGNKMLYQSMEGSMAYGSSIISEKLSNIENLTGIILADSTIQNTLSVTADTHSSNAARASAFRTLSYSIPDYYQNFKQNGIYYMNLYNNSYTIYSDLSRCKSLPENITGVLLAEAHERPGYPIWNTDYCNEYGLFITRDIRRADNLQLDTIGTVLINIDLETVINDSTKQLFSPDPPLYIIYQKEAEIYHTPSLPRDTVVNLDLRTASPYGVLNLDGTAYFYAKGTIPEFGWDYLCLTSYEAFAEAQHLYILLSVSILLLVLLLSFLCSQSLIHSILTHFSDLLHKMDRFGLDETVLPSSSYDYAARKDEIGELHRRFDLMALQVQDLIQKNYVNELLTREAELKSLENQINPHFLYNTLESINWHAKSIGAEQISTMVEALGALLRNTLSRRNSISTVESELDIVKDYMSIIKIRFDERVQYTVTVPEELFPLPLPRFTLQPLVENAIHYALEEMTETCMIHIDGRCSEDTVLLEITNNGSQFPDDLLHKLEESTIVPHGFGIGLLNIHKRIRLQFGPEYGILLSNKEWEDQAIVQIRLPFGGKEGNHDKNFDR